MKNDVAIGTTIGGRNHGNFGLVIMDTRFQQVARQPWNPSVFLGIILVMPSLYMTAAAAAATETVCQQHAIMLVACNTCKNVNKVLKAQLIKAINETN
eukprot:11333834-Ditylum_brightwellii.AAC.1